eukprot:458422_1
MHFFHYMIIFSCVLATSLSTFCNCGYSWEECEAFYQAGCPGSTCTSVGKTTKTQCKARCGSLSFICAAKNDRGTCRCFSSVLDPTSWTRRLLFDDDDEDNINNVNTGRLIINELNERRLVTDDN